MASKKKANSDTEGNAGKEEKAEEKKAQFHVAGQYIKDFSFESPNSPAVLRGPGENPNLQVSVNVNAEKKGENEFEVVLNVNAHAKNDSGVIYNLEIAYGGIFSLQNIPDETLRPLLLIDCPALMFPFVRRIVADTTRDGGFPPLYLDPIDFAGLYKANLKKAQEEAATQPTN